MKRVLTAVVLIPLVLLIVFKAPLWLFALMVGGMIALALHEYLGIAEAAGAKPFHLLTYAAALVVLFVFWMTFSGESTAINNNIMFAGMWLLYLLGPIFFGIPLVFRKDMKTSLTSSACSMFAIPYIVCSLGSLIALRGNPPWNALIIFILGSVWAGDTAAYYVGRSLGRHKLAPVVSPNKTWEGAIASVIASVAVSVLVFHFYGQVETFFRAGWGFQPGVGTRPASQVEILALGVLTNIAAQFGDLFESALKRGAGVKDSGTLIPGHGGILDRIDALLFAVPFVWFYAEATGLMLPNVHV